MVQVSVEEEPGVNMMEEARKAQEEASPEEKRVWQNRGAWKEGSLWRGPGGRPVLTAKMANRRSPKHTVLVMWVWLRWRDIGATVGTHL